MIYLVQLTSRSAIHLPNSTQPGPGQQDAAGLLASVTAASTGVRCGSRKQLGLQCSGASAPLPASAGSAPAPMPASAPGIAWAPIPAEGSMALAPMEASVTPGIASAEAPTLPVMVSAPTPADGPPSTTDAPIEAPSGEAPMPADGPPGTPTPMPSEGRLPAGISVVGSAPAGSTLDGSAPAGVRFDGLAPAGSTLVGALPPDGIRPPGSSGRAKAEAGVSRTTALIEAAANICWTVCRAFIGTLLAACARRSGDLFIS